VEEKVTFSLRQADFKPQKRSIHQSNVGLISLFEKFVATYVQKVFVQSMLQL